MGVKGWLAALALLAGLAAYALSGPLELPSPLLQAAYKGDLDTVRRMLPLEQGRSMPAAEQAGFKQLLRREAAGADVSSTNNAGSTPLHWSCTVPSAPLSRSLITLMLAHGAYVDAANSAGETPLHWAVEWVRPHAVEELLRRGADPKKTDADGNTPLHKIKRDCDESDDCTQLVKLLVAAGADVMTPNAFKRKPLQHFDQDKEGKRQRQAQTQARVHAEDEPSEEEGSVATPSAASSAGHPHPATAAVPLSNRLSDETLERIQAQLEEFKKNLTREAPGESEEAQTE